MPNLKARLNLFFSLSIGLLFLCPKGAFCAEARTDPSWNSLETKHTIIRFLSWEDLKWFNGRIDYSPGSWSLKSLFSSPDPSSLKVELKNKVDALYERVQEILDMRRGRGKVIINLYPDGKQLQGALHEIYNKPIRLRAWYIYERNTIYLNVKDVHEGMLAHEMAHSIIDQYLIVRPPKATAEILARYVDEHLFD